MKIEGVNIFELAELLKLAGKGDFVLVTLKGKRYFRRYVKPRDPRTKKQRERRKKFGETVKEWRKLSEAKKAHYNKLAKRRSMNGMNLFVREYVKGKTS